MDDTGQDDPLAKRRRSIRRAGWGTIGLGGVLGFVAALIGGSAARASNMAVVESALVLRNVAAVIMLIGLVTLLIAQRLEGFQAWFQQRIERNTDPANSAESNPFHVLLAWTIILLIVWFSAGGLPPAGRGRVVLLAALAVPAAVTLLAVQLRGTFRAFLVGVLLAALGNMALVGLATLVLTADVGSARATRELGRHLYPLSTGMWLIAVVFGLLSVALRYSLVNKPPSPPAK